MNRKMTSRLLIDFFMTVLMLAAMAYRIFGNTVHELVGVSVFTLFIIHNILNRRWYNTVFQNKNSVYVAINTTINLLLIVTMLMLMISGIFISHTIFAFIHLNGSMFMRQIHILSAYWGFIFVGVHLGMRWGMIISAVRKKSGTNKILTILLRTFALLIAVYGIKASFDRNIWYKLILYYTFDNWNINETFMKYFGDYLSIMEIYVYVTYYILKLVQRKKNKMI